MQTLRLPDVKMNICIMSYQWMVCSFNFYLLYFIVSSFENGFQTALGVGLADLVSNSCGAILVSMIGVQRTLIYSFALATVGGLITLTYGLSH